MRILIIGAGIGGLCLAQGLVKAGVDVEVYERGSAAADGLIGFGIHVDANGAQAIHDCLPPETWGLFDEAAAPAEDTVRFHDEKLHTLLTRGGFHSDHADDPIRHRRGVSRLGLREVLLTNISETVVRWGKTYTGYRTNDDGTVTALFEDGTEATGDLLVAADGSNSKVRGQYLPHLSRINTGVITVAGRYPLTAENEAELPDFLRDGSVNNVVPAGPGWMFCASWRNPLATTGVTKGGVADSAASDYVVFAFAGNAVTFPNNILDFNPAELRDLVLSRTKGWSPILRLLVEQAETMSLSAISLLSMPKLDPWASSANVTLLGDAIHNMTPLAGIGANTALRDAGLLREVLVEAAAGRTTLLEAVSRYESRMREYANYAVGTSLRNAGTAGAEKKFPRLAFRTVLRVANAVPPIQKKMFARPATA